ncbi:MAG: glycosyltransferase family 2 protein [Acidobacteriota bacterium]
MSEARSPDVGVLVLNWNGRVHLDECLSSLASMDCFLPGQPGVRRGPADVEVCLIDNGSTDGSPEFVAQRHPWVRLLRHERNLGFPAAYNDAVVQCRTEWVAFLNNDTRVPRDWVSRMLAGSRQRPGASFVASRIVNWDGTRVDFDGADTFFTGHAMQRDIGAETAGRTSASRPLLFGCAGALFARRDSFLDCGGFDPDYFSFFEDVDLGWRAAVLGHETWLATDAFVHHKLHATWGRRPMAKTRFLCERNALLNLYKNLSAERMGVVLLFCSALTLVRAWASTSALRLHGQPSLSTDAIAHLLALGGLPTCLEAARPRRIRVQSGRRWADGEVAALFGDIGNPPTVLGHSYTSALAAARAGLRVSERGWSAAWPDGLNTEAEDATRVLGAACAVLLSGSIAPDTFLETDHEHDWEHPIGDAKAAMLRELAGAATRLVASPVSLEAVRAFRAVAEKAAAAACCDVRDAARARTQRSTAASPVRVSVVVRTKDRSELLRRALASVAAQSVLPDEVVIVNDGGCDVADALGVLPAATRRVEVSFAASAGRTRAAQAGLEAASGRFVCFLDDDDVLLPGHIGELLATLDRTGARVAYGNVECVEETASGERVRATVLGGPFDPARIRFENTIPLMALLLDRQLALQTGGFDPSLPYFEDWDLLLRLAAVTPFAHCPSLVAVYHVRVSAGSGVGLTGAVRWPALAAIYERHAADVRGTDWARFYRQHFEPVRTRLRDAEERLRTAERDLADIRTSRLHRLAAWARRRLGHG